MGLYSGGVYTAGRVVIFGMILIGIIGGEGACIFEGKAYIIYLGRINSILLYM